MAKTTGMKLGKIVTGNEELRTLEYNQPVYLDTLGDQYCPYIQVTRVSEDKYIVANLFETKEDSTLYTREEVNGEGVYQHEVNLNASIMNRLLESNGHDYVEGQSLEPTVDNLYIYILDEEHRYGDDRRPPLSKETYKWVKVSA